MALDGTDIHWHDGLFVLQHHLQFFQRSLNSKLHGARQLGMTHPWGVIGMQVDKDSLDEGLVALRSLKAILPSGLLVDVPDSAILEPLRVADALRAAPDGIRVLLAVTNWTPNGANMRDGDHAPGSETNSGRWEVGSIEVRDENDGADPEEILIRRTNARLVLEGSIPAGAEVLPLFRITSDHASAKFAVEIDPAYVGPSIQCGASEEIMSLVKELAARIAAARVEHLAYLSRGGYDADRLAGQQVEWMLRTQAISSVLPRLSDHKWISNSTPFELYHELRSFLGQLSPLRPTRDLYQVPDYDHVDALPVLAELSLRIRNLVFDSGLGSFLAVPFTETSTLGDDLRMDVSLEDAHFIKGKQFYLAIDGEPHGETSTIVDLVLNGDAFKMLPASKAGSRIRGLKLEEDRFPPLALPARPGRIYFKIDETSNSAAWAKVRDERAMATVWSKGRAGQLSMTLVVDTTGNTDG